MRVNYKPISPSYLRGNINTKKQSSENNSNATNDYSTSSIVNSSNISSRINLGKNQKINFGIASFIALYVAAMAAAAIVCAPFVIAAEIYNYTVKTLPQKREAKREAKEKELKEKKDNEIKKIAQGLNVSTQKATKYHDNFLSIASIEPNGNGIEQGINAIRGYGVEKYDLAMRFVAPIVLAQKTHNKQAQDALPNGLLLYGPGGSGKTYIAQHICEHLKNFGIKVEEVVLDETNHTKNVEKIRDAFFKAQERFLRTGQYTVINFPQDMDRTFIDSAVDTTNYQEMSSFLYRADNCASKGAIWIGTANNAKQIDKSVIRRATVRIPIGNMEDFAIADMIKYCLIKHGENETAQNFDYEKVLQYIEDNNIECTPFEYEGFITRAINERVDKNLPVTAELMIEKMKQFEDLDYAINDTTKTRFKNEQEYLKTIDAPKDTQWLKKLDEELLNFDFDSLTEEEIEAALAEELDETDE